MLNHTCPNCNHEVEVILDGRILRDYEWCQDCKDSHYKRDWEVRWFNHRFKVFSKRDIFMRDGFKCYLCSLPLELKSRNSTFDHVVPTSRGGLSTFDNLRLCCNPCNNDKGDLLLDEFLALKKANE